MQVYLVILRMLGLRTHGLPRYISSRAVFDDFPLISLGERTVVSKYVIFLTHDYSVTTASWRRVECPPSDICVKRPIQIGRNVFIGMGAILLPGVCVGDDVIIGAGSVIAKDIPCDSIVVGNPARVVGSLRDRPEKWAEIVSGPFSRIDRF